MSQPSDMLFAAIEPHLKKLADEKTCEIDIRVQFNLGGPLSTTVMGIDLARLHHRKDYLAITARARYMVETQEHACYVRKEVPHIFNQSDVVLTPENRGVIEDALKSLISAVQRICNRCYQQANELEDHKSVCKSCSMEIAFVAIFGEKKVELGKHQQTGCVVCLEDFTSSSLITHSNKCRHVFHYKCFCEMEKHECPLCRKRFTMFKTMRTNGWRCVDDHVHEDEEFEDDE